MKNSISVLLLALFAFQVSCGKNAISGEGSSPVIKPNIHSSDAGGVDGGGGKGVLCGNHLETLDLYEARANHLEIPNDYQDLDANLKKFGKRMAEYFSESSREFSDADFEDKLPQIFDQQVTQHFKDIPIGTRLPPTDDATIPDLSDKCSIVQIAIYSTDGTIYRDSEYWSKLQAIEQAALIIHEAIYHDAKQYGVLKSDESRKAVGMIFSDEPKLPLLSPIWNANSKFWCGAGIKGTSQEIYELYGVDEVQNGVSGLALYFKAFKSIYVTSRTSTFLPGLSVAQFMNHSAPSTQANAENLSTGQNWIFELSRDSNSKYTFRAYSQGSMPPPYSNSLCQLIQ
jgi:hypothetical protein